MSPPAAYAELEVRLSRPRPEEAEVQVELRFDDPRDQTVRPPARARAVVDAAALREHELDPAGYGELLATQLFGGADGESVRSLWGAARAVIAQSGRPLRLLLAVEPSAGDLQGLRWELLRDPQTGERLATSERVLFSRLLFGARSDWRPVALRRKADLTALVAVAAPSDLGDYRLAAVDADAEVARVRAGLGAIVLSVLGQDEPLTLERLIARLQEGVDILYLVCHGILDGREPYLFLQDEAGKVARVSGRQLAERVQELAVPPRLAVLASCESGGSADGTVQGALAPRLGEAGVPAVLAMQGQISLDTVAALVPVFFSELAGDGQLDRALAVARGRVRDRTDAWMPALSLRLKSGRLWYDPGFVGEEDQLQRWRSLTAALRQGRCLPVLGPDVGEHLVGASRLRAGRLADEIGYPFKEHRSDLAKVAQYLSVTESRQLVRETLERQLREEIKRRHPDLADAPRLYEAVVRRCGEADPYHILARLPATVYLTASPDPLLLRALAAAGRRARPLYSKWRKTKDNHPRAPAYRGRPSWKRPVVCYPFGVYRQGDDDSLVLTEDDFLDYLIAAADYQLLPAVVRGTLVRSSLLFLGFPLGELAFRVLFRLIVALDGSAALGDFAHVGVQIDPEQHGADDIERSRRYLTEYLDTGNGTPRIDVYWGSVADFLADLSTQLAHQEEAGPEAGPEDGDDWDAAG